MERMGVFRSQHPDLGQLQGRGFALTLRKVLIETIHKKGCRPIPYRPQRRYDRLGPGVEEHSRQPQEPFAPLQAAPDAPLGFICVAPKP